MIHTPTLTTQDGEIILISPEKVRMQKTQPQGHTIKLSPTDGPTTRLSHTNLHISNIKLPHLLGQTQILKTG
jgi:hypothetical protein